MTKEKKVFKHKPHHWVNTSIDAITDKRLEPFDRCLLLYMTYKFNYTKDVLNASYFEGVQALADVFGVHRNTVSRAIQSLKGLGYIQVTTNKGSSNVYNKVTTWLNCKPPVLVVKSESESVPNQTRNKTTKHAPVEQVVADNNFWIDDEPF